MASIHHEVTVEVSAQQAWTALRAVGAAHELFAPVLVDGELQGDTRQGDISPTAWSFANACSMSTMRGGASLIRCSMDRA